MRERGGGCGMDGEGGEPRGKDKERTTTVGKKNPYLITRKIFSQIKREKRELGWVGYRARRGEAVLALT